MAEYASRKRANIVIELRTGMALACKIASQVSVCGNRRLSSGRPLDNYSARGSGVLRYSLDGFINGAHGNYKRWMSCDWTKRMQDLSLALITLHDAFDSQMII